MANLKPILYFNTVNDIKIREIEEIFHEGFEVSFLKNRVTEILSSSLEDVIKAKSLDAYNKCRVPVIVEHGALCVDFFNGFPAALSKPMWDLMGDKICDLIPQGATRAAKALSAVCYCDGKKRTIIMEETSGQISMTGKGTNGFQWDPIFIPAGSLKTYAEMTQTEKLNFSQAKKAYLKLQKELELK